MHGLRKAAGGRQKVVGAVAPPKKVVVEQLKPLNWLKGSKCDAADFDHFPKNNPVGFRSQRSLPLFPKKHGCDQGGTESVM